MQAGELRLSRRRRRVAGRGRLLGWSLAVVGLAGTATIATSVVQAPRPAEAPPPVAEREPAALAAPVAAPAVPLTQVQAAPTPTAAAAPTAVPNAGGQALLDSLRADLSAAWFKNLRETPFRNGPSDSAHKFNDLPQGSSLKLLERRGEWLLVFYAGDGVARQPGPGWVAAADLGQVEPPKLWIASARSTTLWTEATGTTKRIADLLPASSMEVLGPDAIRGPRIHVRLPGDGRRTPPSEGWIEAADARRVTGIPEKQLPWAYPDVLKAEVRLAVPYRTQFDGSPYSGANCGPTALGMVLEMFGKSAPLREVRTQVLKEMELLPNDDEAGTFIWALDKVARSYGLKTHGLYEADGKSYRRWSLEDVRGELRQGRPVIVQVYYRGLPRRADADYDGDHYVVLTGLMGDRFLYHDPLFTDGEGPGWDRVMTAAELRRSMNASDRPFAYTGFSLGG